MSDTLDSLGMWEATASLPEQVAAAAATAAGCAPVDGSGVRQVVVLGMGGSGIAGDVLAAVAGPRMAVPVVVVKDYAVPASVGPGSLVFAVSFSGDTEEVLAAADQAWAAGARVVAVTGGGELARRAAGHGAPVVPVPGTIPQPRAALGALAVPALVVLEGAGLLPGASALVAAAHDQLARRRDRLSAPGNVAASVAATIGRTLPLVHGSVGASGVAAMRWKTQVNENAKSPAFFAVHPELGHNELAGWGQHGDVTRQLITLVVLRHPGEGPRLARRIDLVTEILREVVAGVATVVAEGEGTLAHLLDLCLVGDMVSLHLAAAAGIDPGPVPILGQLKQALRTS